MKKKTILILLAISIAMFFLINLFYSEKENTAFWSYETLSKSLPIILIIIIVNIAIILTSKKK